MKKLEVNYLFAFEILKPYNFTRSYIIKAPLKKSFKEKLAEMLTGRI